MGKDARVNGFTFFGFVLMSVCWWAIFQTWWANDIRWLALAMGACFAVAMLVDRKDKHDQLMEPTYFAPEKQPEQTKTEIEYKPQIQSENGNRIRYAKFALTRAQWANLARAIRKDGKVTRDVVAKANAFTNLTAKWPQIIKEFERLGWVDDGELTDAGNEWFAQYDPPAPSKS